MKIIVTGGAGFIGSHIVDAYLDAGHEVVVLDDLSTGRIEHIDTRARFHEADIRSDEASRIIRHECPEIINHHAAQIDVRASVQEPVADVEVNVAGTVNLLEAARLAGTRKVIFASTGGAMYGETPDRPATEEDPPLPISHYGVSKWSCEQYLRLYTRLYGIEHTALRYPNVYGPRQNPAGESGVCAIFARALLRGERPVVRGDGGAARDYVHVSDIVQANLAALEAGSNATINLGSGTAVSVREIFDTVQRIVGSDFEPLHEALQPGELTRALISGNKASLLLNWTPTVSLGDGLQTVVEYCRTLAALETAR